jgi:DNA invertase Pin-like site-specific DNA recombinase
MQDALAEQAKADGYREDQIIVEARDLGISGTKGPEARPGLAALIQAIEANEVEAVYVVHISCISRDQTLIDGLEFGELCKQHRVLIVMPTMRLNLRDSMHLRLYRQEIERAADEIELLKPRLGGPKRHKALSGRFDGRSVVPGYFLDHNQHSESYQRYIIYPPHAEVVRAIFRALITTGTPMRAARWLRDRQDQLRRSARPDGWTDVGGDRDPSLRDAPQLAAVAGVLSSAERYPGGYIFSSPFSETDHFTGQALNVNGGSLMN